MRARRLTQILWALAWCVSLSTVAGCTAGRADARVAYWTQETRTHVPIGSRIEEAQAFFASRGLELRCCMSGPDIDRAYSAMERNIGRFVWTEYSALIVVDVTADRQVRRVRVLRVGVGL
jgi:hypothetical protein